MHRALAVVVLLGCGVAFAQPGATPPAPYPPPPPYPAPYPPPTPYPPPAPYPPYGYAPPPAQLTADEQATLQIGYVSDGQLIGGGLASLFLGFGIGQAVEGRWSDTGWIFSLGEPAAFGLVVYGAVQLAATCDTPNNGRTCSSSGGTALVAGALALTGLRIWEVVDAFIGPGRQNTRLRAVHMKLGYPMPMYGAPFVVPANGGAVAGLSLRF